MKVELKLRILKKINFVQVTAKAVKLSIWKHFKEDSHLSASVEC